MSTNVDLILASCPAGVAQWLNVIPLTERSQVRLLVRADAQIAGLILSRGHA